jgi:tetratricopeptide (TPR) repeat protein
MVDRYRIDRSFGGGYTSRKDVTTDVLGSAGAIAGNIVGAGIEGLVNAARNARDRRMQRAVEAMEAAAEAKNYDRLFLLADDFVDLYPQEPYGHAFLALALAEKGQHGKGLAATDRAVELGMDKSEGHILRAHIYEHRGSIGKVIQEFSALIRIAETRSYGLLNRALALVEIGDLDQAPDDINHGIAESPDEFFYYAHSNTYLAKGEIAKAVDDYMAGVPPCT